MSVCLIEGAMDRLNLSVPHMQVPNSSPSSSLTPSPCCFSPIPGFNPRQSKRFCLSIQVPNSSLTDDSLSHSQAPMRHLGRE
mmetsp:Transcript_1925/g.4873  ORF Transcript_1925/g.4873 Transcript_1925/m.4873 type:complete len:82 (+) Transcript_1925:111-356(+)